MTKGEILRLVESIVGEATKLRDELDDGAFKQRAERILAHTEKMLDWLRDLQKHPAIS